MRVLLYAILMMIPAAIYVIVVGFSLYAYIRFDMLRGKRDESARDTYGYTGDHYE